MTDHTQLETAVEPAVFRRVVGSVETRFPIPIEEVEASVRVNIKRNLPRFHERADFGKWKGKPIAIVAGGPSLRKTIDELRSFETVMVCGSAHDYVIENGIVPTYAVSCETVDRPGERATDFMHLEAPGCEYLLATCNPPCVFDELQDRRICVWNSQGPDPAVFNGEPVIGGGCTVTLRAINLAILMGFYEMHFFGMDSSFEDNADNHAYDAGASSMFNTIKVRVGSENGREFLTNNPWMAQAAHFQEMLQYTGHMFNPTIHGDGLIAEIVKQATALAKQQEH